MQPADIHSAVLPCLPHRWKPKAPVAVLHTGAGWHQAATAVTAPATTTVQAGELPGCRTSVGSAPTAPSAWLRPPSSRDDALCSCRDTAVANASAEVVAMGSGASARALSPHSSQQDTPRRSSGAGEQTPQVGADTSTLYALHQRACMNAYMHGILHLNTCTQEHLPWHVLLTAMVPPWAAHPCAGHAGSSTTCAEQHQCAHPGASPGARCAASGKGGDRAGGAA